jgi:sensor histidine kinase regulating citrate/malate metabolism
MNIPKKAWMYWLLITISITITAIMVYGVGQQILRQSADDPQIQIAEDTAKALERGQTISIPPSAKNDVSKSLTSFIVVYDASKKFVTSSITVNNNNPVLPISMLEQVDKKGETKVTWEPAKGIKAAVVIVKHGGQAPGYVAIGRSLREIDKRINDMGNLIVLIWLISIIAILAILWLANIVYDKKILTVFKEKAVKICSLARRKKVSEESDTEEPKDQQ